MIALTLVVLAFLCWRWSFAATDRLVATVRWCFAMFLLLLGVVVGLVMLCH